MYPTVRMKALRPRLIEAMRATDALFNEENVFDPQSAEGVVRIAAIAVGTRAARRSFRSSWSSARRRPAFAFAFTTDSRETMSVLRHGDLDLAVYSTLGKACPPDFHEQTLFSNPVTCFSCAAGIP